MNDAHDDDEILIPYALTDLAYTTGPGEAPRIGNFGGVILEDGTTHTLRKQFTHGMLLALLFPEQAAAAGFAPPDASSGRLRYQGFELENHATLPAVRIATGGLLDNINVSKSDAAATQAQVTATLAYLRGLGMKPGDKVHLDVAEVSVSRLGGLLLLDDEAMRTKLWGT